MKICTNCGSKLGKKDKFCDKCGSSTFAEVSNKAKFCHNCGSVIEGKAKFCAKCGKPVENGISLAFLDEKPGAPVNADLDFLKTPEQLAAEQAAAGNGTQFSVMESYDEDSLNTQEKLDFETASLENIRKELEARKAEIELLVKQQEEKVAKVEELKKQDEIEKEEARKRQEEEERRRKEEEERLRKEEEERKKREEEERLRREEEERLRKEEEERLRKEEEERLRKEEEERLRKEEEERLRKEEEERKKREEEERLRREEEERIRKEEEERLRKEEEERLRKEEEERLRKEEEERLRREEEERIRREEEERLRKEEEERLRKEEEERKAREAEEARLKALKEDVAACVKNCDAAIEGYKKNPESHRADLQAGLDKIETLKKEAGDDVDTSSLNEAYYKIQEILGVLYYKEGAHKLAVPMLEYATDQGSIKASIYYCQWLIKNRSKMPKEPDYLKKLMEDSINSGLLSEEEKAMCYGSLAKILHDGIGTSRNLPEAFEYFKKGAALGDVKAVAKVGQCYLYGEGVTKDGKLALEWSEKAANEGNETGIRNVAVCYDFGTGTKKDAKMAIEWYKKLLDKVENDRFAMYRIAYCTINPDKEYNMKADEAMMKEAFTYATKAVEGGEENANYLLGYLYMTGKVVMMDYNKAVAHFTKAANFGNSKARDKVKLFVKNGSGNYVLK